MSEQEVESYIRTIMWDEADEHGNTLDEYGTISTSLRDLAAKDIAEFKKRCVVAGIDLSTQKDWPGDFWYSRNRGKGMDWNETLDGNELNRIAQEFPKLSVCVSRDNEIVFM